MEPGGGQPARCSARKTWRTLEPLHGMVYFVPEAAEAYARLGITGRAGYFASRAAPMGAVTADVVVSTFFNFNPELVHAAIPAVWEVATPVALVAARFRAVDAALRRLLGDEVVSSDEMRRAAELARLAAEEAAGRVEGRPLAAAHIRCRVARPRRTCVLWHAQSILREYRGDGHIAQLVVRGLSGLEALVTHAAAGDVPEHVLRSTRGGPRTPGTARSMHCGCGAGWSRVTNSASRSGEQANAGLSRRGPTRWLRRPMPCWAKSAARSCGPWPGRGARRSPNSCPDELALPDGGAPAVGIMAQTVRAWALSSVG